VARVLIVGCGCRGRSLAGALVADGHAVRGTTRDHARTAAIEESGADAVVADPDRLGTLMTALVGVSAICWLMGGAADAPALNGERLETLTERFLPLARSLAMRYHGGGEPLEDLVQVASLGLVKAIEGFDPARGKPFNAYAVPTILGELRRHFRDRVWNLHLPRSLQELTMRVDDAVDALTEANGRSPTVAEIAADLDVGTEDVLEAMGASEARRTLSLDAPRWRDDGDLAPAVETVGAEDPGYDRVEAELASSTADLSERERSILEMRFGEDMTQSEIGAVLGISQMQVSRLMRRALRKLLASVRGEVPA
jgi:RNA polymerase sigma-B factor